MAKIGLKPDPVNNNAKEIRYRGVRKRPWGRYAAEIRDPSSPGEDPTGAAPRRGWDVLRLRSASGAGEIRCRRTLSPSAYGRQADKKLHLSSDCIPPVLERRRIDRRSGGFVQSHQAIKEDPRSGRSQQKGNTLEHAGDPQMVVIIAL